MIINISFDFKNGPLKHKIQSIAVKIKFRTQNSVVAFEKSKKLTYWELDVILAGFYPASIRTEGAKRKKSVREHPVDKIVLDCEFGKFPKFLGHIWDIFGKHDISVL